MKRLISLLLTLTLALSLAPAALGAEAVTPTPPSWVPAEEYAVFEGSVAYEPENWELLLALRKEVAWGDINLGALPKRSDYNKLVSRGRQDPGLLFELALIENRLLFSHDGNTGTYWTTMGLYTDPINGDLYSSCTPEQQYVVRLWDARGIFRSYGAGKKFYPRFTALAAFPQFSMDALADTVILTPEQQQELRDLMIVSLDGVALEMDVQPQVRQNRTMVPIRAVAERLGADVEWQAATQQIVMTRAGSTVTMTLDSTAATVDGKAVTMDVAPYAIDGATLIPARYVAEFFGQLVDWDGGSRTVRITEDKSMAKDSNLEAWALPMGAMLSYVNYDDPVWFGAHGRAPYPVDNMGVKQTYEPWRYCRNTLERGWSVSDREGLISTIERMTASGHNTTFLEMAADVKIRSAAERASISAASDVWPAYMWEYTETVEKKWGDKGILAWDLFRMSNLVQWGYTAGYLTYAEALDLLEPAAKRLCETFSSWDEAYENYLDGYNWWARNDVLGKDIWETSRGKSYLQMKDDPAVAHIFDDTLFQTGVIGLPE